MNQIAAVRTQQLLQEAAQARALASRLTAAQAAAGAQVVAALGAGGAAMGMGGPALGAAAPAALPGDVILQALRMQLEMCLTQEECRRRLAVCLLQATGQVQAPALRTMPFGLR